MRVLVTGGAGFVGAHVVDVLVADGHEVVVLDRVTRRPNPDATYVRGDLAEPDAWLNAARGVDAVCHQAARVGLGVDFADVRAYVQDNDTGTAAGLWTLDAIGFRGRLVLASSMVVYGEGAYQCDEHGAVRPGPRRVADLDAGRFDPTCPSCGAALMPVAMTEDARTDPRNVYAATKLHQEHLCAMFGREHGVAVTALRYHNVYGPGMPRDTPYAGVAAIFRSELAADRAPRVFEDGAQTRDFVHVRDVARANVLALTAPPDVGIGAFNVASGQPRSVAEMAGALADAFGPDAPRPQVVGGYRLGDVRHVFASPTRAEVVFGFRPQVAWADGIAEVVTAI